MLLLSIMFVILAKHSTFHMNTLRFSVYILKYIVIPLDHLKSIKLFRAQSCFYLKEMVL